MINKIFHWHITEYTFPLNIVHFMLMNQKLVWVFSYFIEIDCNNPYRKFMYGENVHFVCACTHEFSIGNVRLHGELFKNP